MLIGFATLGLRFDGRSLDRSGLGGSETACICLARELAKRGHEVHVFCATDRPGDYDGVTYHHLVDLPKFNAERAFDVFVCSRFPEILQQPVHSALTLFWAHDMLDDVNRLQSCLWQVDKVICLSKFQADDYIRQLPKLAPLIWQSSNGVDMDLVRANIRPKVLGKLIYTSRPERGLLYLLRDIFPKLLEQRPDLTLHVATYDTPGLPIPEHTQAIYAECNRLMDNLDDRVIRLGSLPKAKLYQEMSSSELWLYPTDFPEISCIGAMEAQACGCAVISTEGFALTETVGNHWALLALIDGVPPDQKYIAQFTEHAGNVLNFTGTFSPWEPHETYAAGEAWIEKSGFTWPAVAEKWEAMSCAMLTAKGFDCWKHSEQGVAVFKDKVRRPTIACCMIVKNEEADLYRCLRHVRPFVDELHIIDTGSTDRTMEIAKQFNPDRLERVDFDNFADARNQSIAGVKADWILWIDADEVLIGGDKIRQFLGTPYFEGYAIRQRHLMLDCKESVDTPVRIFRNRPHYRFTGYVHEHIEDTSQGPFDCQLAPVMALEDVQLAHYGYIAEPLRREKVSNRNLDLLRRSSIEQPERQLTWVFITRDCLQMSRWHFQEHGFILPGGEHHQMLCSAVEIFLTRFASPSHKYHAMAYPIYQDVLQLMSMLKLPATGREHPPFEVAFGMGGATGGIPNGHQLESKTRWWPDRALYESFVRDATGKMFNAMQIPETPVVDRAPMPELAKALSNGVNSIPHKYLKDGRATLSV